MLDKRIVESLWPDQRARLGRLVIGIVFAFLFVPAVVFILAIMVAMMNSTSVPRVIELWLFPGWLIAGFTWACAVIFGYGVQGIRHFGWRRAGWFRFMALGGLVEACLTPVFWQGHPLILIVTAVIIGPAWAVAFLAVDGSKGYYWVYLEGRVHGNDPAADLGPEGSPVRELSSVRNLLKVYIAFFSPFAVAPGAAWLVIHFSRAH